jgi:hypothetical protein
LRCEHLIDRKELSMPRSALRAVLAPAPLHAASPLAQRQVYLLETHPGTLCRVLDLYAARGIAVTSLRYDHAAPLTMMLTVTAHAEPERMRVLVAKAAAQVGVIEAAMG